MSAQRPHQRLQRGCRVDQHRLAAGCHGAQQAGQPERVRAGDDDHRRRLCALAQELGDAVPLGHAERVGHQRALGLAGGAGRVHDRRDGRVERRAVLLASRPSRLLAGLPELVDDEAAAPSVGTCSPRAPSSCASENPPWAASEMAAVGLASANTRRSSKLRRRALSGTAAAPARQAANSATTRAGTLDAITAIRSPARSPRRAASRSTAARSRR